MTQSRVLVTGGAGFIGSFTAERFQREGWAVRVLDDLSTGSIENIEHLKEHGSFRYTIDTVINEPVVAELIQNTLVENGYRVIECSDGREAVDSFRNAPESVDLVLLDYRMPRLNGVEAFDAIHAASPGLPVILMSGAIKASQLEGLRARGLYSILRKPYSRDELLREVRLALDDVAADS